MAQLLYVAAIQSQYGFPGIILLGVHKYKNVKHKTQMQNTSTNKCETKVYQNTNYSQVSVV